MKFLHKYDLTIRNIDSQLAIFVTQPKTHYIKLTRQKVSWEKTLHDSEKLINRLTMAIQREQSMQVNINMTDDESEIIIDIFHPAYDTVEHVQLLKCASDEKMDFGMLELEVSKITDIIKNVRKVYPIYRHMLGPKYTHCDIFSNITKTKQLINDFIKFHEHKNTNAYLPADQQEKIRTEKTRLDTLMPVISEYYKINHVYQNTRPVVTDNQILMDGLYSIIYSRGECAYKKGVEKKENMYTIFTKKFQDLDVIGFIEHEYFKSDINRCTAHDILIRRISIHLPVQLSNVLNRKEHMLHLDKYFDSHHLLNLPGELMIMNGLYKFDGSITKKECKSALSYGCDYRPGYVHQNKLFPGFYPQYIENDMIRVDENIGGNLSSMRCSNDIYFGGTLLIPE